MTLVTGESCRTASRQNFAAAPCCREKGNEAVRRRAWSAEEFKNSGGWYDIETGGPIPARALLIGKMIRNIVLRRRNSTMFDHFDKSEGNTDAMRERHLGGLYVVADQCEDQGTASEHFVVYDDAGRLPSHMASFNPENGNLAIRDSRDMNDRASPVLRIKRAKPYRRYFGRASNHQLPPLNVLQRLGAAMSFNDFADIESDVPAGYTYLGQFVCHDMTHMTALRPGREPLNLRSAALDLDSIFDDPLSYLKAEPCSRSAAPMQLGCTANLDLQVDLPRTKEGHPIVADERNDDNLPVAQIHMALLRFHNAVAQAAADESEAKSLSRLHFQSVVLHDYLPRIVDREVYCEVMARGRAIIHAASGADRRERVFLLPLEFVAACGRFGHSMIRNTYAWNDHHPGAKLAAFWENTFNSAVKPMTRLPDDWITRWQRLLGFGLGEGERPIMAACIRPCLAHQLKAIRPEALPDPEPPSAGGSNNLATRSLERAYRLRLNSGQEVARQMMARLESLGRPAFAPLNGEEMLADESDEVRKIMQDRGGGAHARLVDETPLWFYTLKEAAMRNDGKRLGPLGSRIVMETLHAAIEEACPSILKSPRASNWRPDARLRPSAHDRYSFPDLIGFAGLF